MTQSFLNGLEAFGEPLDTPTADILDRLVKDLHGYANPYYSTLNIWSKFLIMYPMLGITAFSHSLNLVDIAQHAITWNGSPTHSGNGVQFNGVNQYGDTNCNAFAAGLTPASVHLSYYNPAAIATGAVWIDMGAAVAGGTWLLLSIDDQFDDAYAAGNNGRKVSYVNTGAKDVFCIGTSQSASLRKVFHDGVFKSQDTGDGSADTLPNKNIWIGGPNWVSGLTNMSGRPCAFASMGLGLTDDEVAFFTVAHAAFQMALGRMTI